MADFAFKYQVENLHKFLQTLEKFRNLSKRLALYQLFNTPSKEIEGCFHVCAIFAFVIYTKLNSKCPR